MKRTIVLVIALLFPAILSAKMDVIVSIVPQKYFVEKIAGDLVDVTVMVPPGASPASYEPKPSQMKKVAKARLYLSIGVPFEKAWLPRFAAQNRKMRVVDTAAGIAKRPMQSHRHGHEHGLTRHAIHADSLDPHVWLSPPLVKIMARNIAEALEESDPVHAAEYRRNLRLFEREVDDLDRRLKSILKPCRGMAMMVFHPSWGYFAHEYGLKQIPIEAEGKEPKSRELAELVREAKEEEVRALFVQPQFSRRAAEAVASSIGAKIVIADPLAAEWAQNLLEVAKRVCEASR